MTLLFSNMEKDVIPKLFRPVH